MTRLKIHLITKRTAEEWPADHPLRKLAGVATDQGIAEAEFLICSIEGEQRLQPAPLDYDVRAACAGACGRAIIYRSSAPQHLKKICWQCWDTIK